MQGSMRGVVAVIATVAMLIGVGVAAGASQAATSRATCNDLAYLNGALRAAKQNLAGWKAANRNAYSTAIVWFKKARYNVSSATTPCEFDYLRHRRYQTQQYDANVRYAQAARRGDWEDADYWMDESNAAADLASIWMD